MQILILVRMMNCDIDTFLGAGDPLGMKTIR